MIYQRVLVPVSGKNSGERAAKALRHAKTLCSGEIILLHVTEVMHRRILRRHTTEYWRLYRTAPFPRNASMIPCGESTVSNMRINWNSKEDRRRLHVSAVVFFLVKNGRSCYLSNKSNISLTNSHIVD